MIDYRIAAIGLLGIGVLVASAVMIGSRPQPAPSVAPVPSANPKPSAALVPPVPAPAPPAVSAPPVPDQSAPAPRLESRPQAKAKPVAELPVTGTAGAGNAPNPKFTHFRVGNRNVKRIFVDGERVWVGTSGGVIRYSPASDEFKLYDARSGLRGNGTTYVGKLGGRIAVGSQGGGLSLLEAAGETWESFGVSQGLADDLVADVLVAANGDIWIATGSGVNRVRGGALRDRAQWDLHTSRSTNQGIPSDRVYGVAEGRNGDIWFATEGGVARFRNGEWSHWKLADDPVPSADAGSPSASPHGSAARGKNPNFTVAVAVDRSGVVWAGTLGGGLARFDGGRWKHYTLADGLPGNNVFVLHQDEKNRLWIGTDNGLARLQDGKFKVMTTDDGLFKNAVFAMASANRSIWVGGYGGVARIREFN